MKWVSPTQMAPSSVIVLSTLFCWQSVSLSHSHSCCTFSDLITNCENLIVSILNIGCLTHYSQHFRFITIRLAY